MARQSTSVFHVSTLPAAVLLVLWWKRGRLSWRDVTPLLPFFLVAGMFGNVMNLRHLAALVGEERPRARQPQERAPLLVGRRAQRRGVPIVPDPRPDQGFFFRSDNLPFVTLVHGLTFVAAYFAACAVTTAALAWLLRRRAQTLFNWSLLANAAYRRLVEPGPPGGDAARPAGLSHVRRGRAPLTGAPPPPGSVSPASE